MIKSHLAITGFLVSIFATSVFADSPADGKPAEHFTYHYYSLQAEHAPLTNILADKRGELDLVVGGDSGYAGSYCVDDPKFICLNLPGVYFAVPKDLESRISLITSGNSIDWTFDGKRYSMPLDKGRRDFRLLGHPFSAHWIHAYIPDKEGKYGTDAGRYLWSSTCGLLAFTQLNELKSQRDPVTGSSFEEFWSEDEKGFGATPECGK